MHQHHALKPRGFALARYSLVFLLMTSGLGIHAQAPNPLEVPALVRMTADKPEQSQIFRGPINTTKTWRLCVVLPNVSDTFWDEVMRGVREESARLGVDSVIYEASGYSEAGLMQQERILNQRCSAGKLDAVLLAAVDRTGLNKSLHRLREQKVLIIDFVNGYDPQEVDARAFLDNYHLGKTSGLEVKKYLAEHPPKHTPKILWIPGPTGADWVKRGDEGFKDALKDVAVEIETLHLTPHYREQNRDLRQHLQTGKTYDLIVGTGPTSVAAYQLKAEGIIKQDTPVFAYYATPDVLKLLAKKQVISAVSNEPRIQGRMGVALAVGLLEKLPMPYQIGPAPVLLKP
jgi:protein TorT